ncbi:MAG: AsmA-like C-terminal region-containing protein [Adhaeribacter sp.]
MWKKKILKYGLWGLIVVLVLAPLALELGARLYREKAAAYFRDQFSRRSDQVLAPFQTSVSVWRHFPRVTFTFHQLSVTDTSGAAPLQVLAVGRAEVTLPLTQFRPDRIRIGRVLLDQVLFRQLVDSTGHKTALRFRQGKAGAPGSPPDWVLPRLRITRARIFTENKFKKSTFSLLLRQADLAGRQSGGKMRLAGKLAGQIGELRSNKLRLFRGQAFTAQVNYDYHAPSKKGSFRQTQALVNGRPIRLAGWHQALAGGQGALLNLRISGDQPLMYLFRQLLPPQTQPFLRRVRSNSRLHLDYRITGKSGPRLRPRNQLYFALRQGTFYLPASKKYLRQVQLRGLLDNGPAHAPQSSRFALTHLSAGSGANRFQLRLEVKNFLQPAFALRGQGRMELPNVAAFITLPLTSVIQGSVSGTFHLRGQLADTAANKSSRWQGQGRFQVQHASFQPLGLAATCRQVNASLSYTDSLLQLHNLSGTIGGHPFRLRASVRNYSAYLFNEPGLIVSQASIYARQLNLHWLNAPILEEPAGPGQPAPNRQPAGSAPAAGPGSPLAPPLTWKHMQTRVELVVDQLQVPGREQVQNLRVQVRQRGAQVALQQMRFNTSRGGKARAQGGFRLIPGGISRPSLHVQVDYASLNLQAFLQNLAAFKSTRPGAAARQDKNKKRMNEYLEKKYWVTLEVKARKVQYLYLQGAHLVVAANMNRQRALLSRLQLQALGGSLQARGEMQLNAPGNTYPLKIRAQAREIRLPHLFRVAEAMQLDLLSSRSIRGSADCQLELYTSLDQTFSPAFDRTVAYARTTFRNMELINVAPIQQALRFLRRQRTGHLYFQDVRADFLLDHNRFLTPGFDLNSNLTDFRLGGSYTMEGPANLHLDVNVLSILFGNNKKRIEKIKADTTALPGDSLAGKKTGRKQHLQVLREPHQLKYKVKLSNRKTRDQDLQALRAEYNALIQRHRIDTVFSK